MEGQATMVEDKHECPRNNSNIIFHSKLWKSWVLKIMNEGVKRGVFDPVLIVIIYCPYCGEKL